MMTLALQAPVNSNPTIRFGSDGCPVCLGAMALKATQEEMRRIREQNTAPLPTVMPAHHRMQASVSGSRAAVVPEEEEDNVILSTFKRLYDKARQKFDLSPDDALLNTVMKGVDTARSSHDSFAKRLQGSNRDPVPFFPDRLPARLDQPHTYNVVHYQNHPDGLQGKLPGQGAMTQASLKMPYAMGSMTLQQLDDQQPELVQLNAREYPTRQQWMAAGTATALATVLATRDSRFKRLAVITEPYRQDLPNPYQPDVLSFIEQLRQRGVEVSEYNLPEAGKLGKYRLPPTPLPASYKTALKQAYPQTWQSLRMFQIPLEPFRQEHDRLQQLVKQNKLNPLYVEDKLLGFVWTGEKAGLS